MRVLLIGLLLSACSTVSDLPELYLKSKEFKIRVIIEHRCTMGRADFYRHGDNNVICDRCGVKYKASDLRREWNGLYTCPYDFEPRHPQDLIRSKHDDQRPSLSRPEGTDVFVPEIALPPDPCLWDVGCATYVSAFRTSPDAEQYVQFSDDQTKLFGVRQNVRVNQYSLAIPGDIRTVGSVEATWVIGTIGGLDFSADGRFIFVFTGGNSPQRMQRYALASPFDITVTPVFVDQYSFTGIDEGLTDDVRISASGLNLYAVQRAANEMRRYSMSAPNDLSSAVYTGDFFDYSATVIGGVHAFYIRDDESRFFTLARTEDFMFQCSMSEPGVLSSVTVDASTYDLFELPRADEEINPTPFQDFWVNPEGSQMYITYYPLVDAIGTYQLVIKS